MGTASSLLAGTAYLTVDARTYMVAGKAAYGVSGTEREAVMGWPAFGAPQQAYAGYSEKPVPGKITLQLRDSADFHISDVQGMTDVSVHLELANGKTVSGSSMFVANALEVDTENGVFEIQFVGPRVEEI